ncbi:MAG: hypothetical protein RLZ58_685 [Pseudomonadota bacterium]|jgi:phage repressor protein C with HTH and peptisase S24 domain
MSESDADRLKRLRQQAKLTQAELAAKAGVAQTTIGNLEAGLRGYGKSVLAIAAALGVPPTQLTTKVGRKGSRPHEVVDATVVDIEPAPALKPPKTVPVVGEVKGGADGYLDELEYPVGHGDGFISYPTTDPHAYALRVRGDSMHPRYRAGEFIVVSPSVAPQPGDDVVVALIDGRKLLKELNWIRDGEAQLLSVANQFAPLTIALADIERMHLVDGRVRRSALIRG